MNVFELMATLSLDTGEYERRLAGAEGQGEEAQSSIGKKFVSLGKVAAKALAAATGVAASGVATITTMAIKNYASYEQLVGGVETLFKNSANKVQYYANTAYKTAGMSSNAYMETVTSFSAALISSLKGDTNKAADQANKAITDMSDNANKMGSSMESISNAYQGFAKQNYTMLDNLKLGYGGTKEEMQRLLSDAEKISGQKFDLSSYSDIVDAIHVVQTEMGITGTTSKEAATTIEGSLSSMKASWSNLVTAMAGGGDIEESLTVMGETAVTFFKGNLIPRIQTTFEGMSGAISKAVPKVVSAIPGLFSQIVPGFVTATTNAVMTIGQTAGDLLANNLPTMLSAAMSGGTQLIQTGINMINQIAAGLKEGIPTFFEQAMPMLLTFSEWINTNAGLMIDAGLNLIMQLVQGLANSIPTLVSYVPQIVINIADVINNNAPKILATGVAIILTLAKGLIKAIPTIVANIPTIIRAIIAVFQAFNWINLGKQIITLISNGVKALATAIPNAMKSIGTSASNLFKGLDWGNLGISLINKIVSALTGAASKIPNALLKVASAAKNAFLKVDWASLGTQLVAGVARGITGAVGKVASAAANMVKTALGKAKKEADVHSPSKKWKKELGSMLPAGTAEGIEENTDQPVKAVKDMIDKMSDASVITTSSSGYESGSSNSIETLIRTIIEKIDKTEERVFNAVARVLDNMGIKYDDREIARIIMEVVNA